MSQRKEEQVRLHDFGPQQDRFYEEVLNGMQKSEKELPSKYFYDEQICRLDEYYIPRVETAIMSDHIGENG